MLPSVPAISVAASAGAEGSKVATSTDLVRDPRRSGAKIGGPYPVPVPAIQARNPLDLPRKKSKSMEKITNMPPFSSLPEECIEKIICFTSPKDACSAATVSTGFRSAADSDAVWERFLPPDYQELISQSDSPVPFSTKKELYLLLSSSGLLLHGGKLSFKLRKTSGKKCYMVCASELQIAWKDTPMYWNWKSFPQSRFSEVAELLNVCWLDIRSTLSSELLSPNTNYGAYLVFKLEHDHIGLDCPSKVWFKCIGENIEENKATRVKTVYMVPPPGRSRNRGCQRSRNDGWMEIELGEVFIPEGARFNVEGRFFETKKLWWKRGLIVEGIEVRPKDAC